MIVIEGGSVPQSAEGAQQEIGVGLGKFDPLIGKALEVESLELDPPQALSIAKLNQSVDRNARSRYILISLKASIRMEIP